MKMSRVIVLLVLAQGLVGCGSHAPVSPTAPTPTPAATPTVTRVAINGNVPLTKIGETTQLTATATRSDNTTKCVTSRGTWARGGFRRDVDLVHVHGSAPRDDQRETEPGTVSVPMDCRYEARPRGIDGSTRPVKSRKASSRNGAKSR